LGSLAAERGAAHACALLWTQGSRRSRLAYCEAPRGAPAQAPAQALLLRR
jgi:hypothetical protein